MPSVRRLVVFNSGAFVYGAEKGLLNLIMALASDYEITVFLPSDGPLVGLLRRQGCKVFIHPLAILSCPNSLFWGFNYSVLSIFNILYFSIYVLQAKCDCFVSNTSLLVFPLFSAKLCGKKFVWYFREFFLYQGINRILAFLAYNFSDAVVCMSRNIFWEVFGRKQKPGAKIRVIYEPLPNVSFSAQRSASLRRELGISENEVVISIIARLHPLKGQLEFLREYYGIIKNNVVVLLAGNSSLRNARGRKYEQQIERFINDSGLSKSVRLLGYRQDTDDLLGLSDICVFPYRRNEPFGIAFQEAVAAGKQVLYARNPGLEEAASCFEIKEIDYLSEGSLKRCIREAPRRRGEATVNREKEIQSSVAVYEERIKDLFRGIILR
jgi:glycosyltransferase involved in cell wall biosynthesis